MVLEDKTRNEIYDIMYEISKYMNRPSRDLFIDCHRLVTMAEKGQPAVVSIEIDRDMTYCLTGDNLFAQFVITYDGMNFKMERTNENNA